MNRATSQELHEESIDKLDIIDRQVQLHAAKEMELTQGALELLSGESAVVGDTFGVDGPCITPTQKLDQAAKVLRNAQQQRGRLPAKMGTQGGRAGTGKGHGAPAIAANSKSNWLN
jgi:hypothetical protein